MSELTLERLKVARNAPAILLKLAAILRYKIVALCGDPNDQDGALYPPSVEELAKLLDEELRLFDLIEFARLEAFNRTCREVADDSLLSSLEAWRYAVLESAHYEP